MLVGMLMMRSFMDQLLKLLLFLLDVIATSFWRRGHVKNHAVWFILLLKLSYHCTSSNYGYRISLSFSMWMCNTTMFINISFWCGCSDGRDEPASKRLKSSHSDQHTFRLKHGSLLVMRGYTQRDWIHSVPKRAKADATRINLTFRRVFWLAWNKVWFLKDAHAFFVICILHSRWSVLFLWQLNYGNDNVVGLYSFMSLTLLKWWVIVG